MWNLLSTTAVTGVSSDQLPLQRSKVTIELFPLVPRIRPPFSAGYPMWNNM